MLLKSMQIVAMMSSTDKMKVLARMTIKGYSVAL
jgi:hypothetical protein